MARDERLKDLEAKYEGYAVYDNAGEKIGKVDDLFVDEADREEYIGVKMGFFGLNSTLIPMELVRVNERDRTIEVSESKDHVKEAPNFSDDDDITPEYEDRVRRHFGLESLEPSAERGAYGRDAADAVSAEGGVGAGDRVGRESYRNREDLGHPESATEPAGAAATPSGGMADLETSDRERVMDEGYREGFREGFREGLREGLREGGGSGEPGDRGDLGPSDAVTGAGPAEEGMTRRGAGDREDRVGAEGIAERSGDETRETPRRPDEGEQEEGSATRVWRRIRN